MPPPQSDVDRRMRALESEIKRLEAEYNMFFAGRLPRLPWERRARVETLVKTFDRSETRNTADLFRFQSLQARFVKLLELWERQLREREEGGRPKAKRGRAAAAPAATPETAAEPAAKKRARGAPTEAPASRPEPPMAPPPSERPERVEHVVSFPPASAAADRVKELYERVAEARRTVGEAPLAYDRIAALVSAQLQKHSSRDAEVAFRVAVKDGKVSLTVTAGDDQD